MGAPQKDTTAFHLRIETKMLAEIELLQARSDFRSANQFAVWLLEEAVALAQNPDQCPPLSHDFMRMRAKLHGQPSGTYADEPGKVPAGPTVAGNIRVNEHMAETLNTLATLLASKDAEIARLRALAFPHEKKVPHAANGGAAA